MFLKNVRYLIALKSIIFQRNFHTLSTWNILVKTVHHHKGISNFFVEATLVTNYINYKSMTKDSQNKYESSVTLLSKCLDDAMKDQNTHISLLVSSSIIQNFCESYNCLSPNLQKQLLLYMCDQYGVQHQKVIESCDSLLKNAKLKVSGVRLCNLFFINQ